MRERAADIKDISERVISNLCEDCATDHTFDEPVIIIADDLAPSETMQLDKSKIIAFVTENGAVTSHTAILARTMNIPALISVKGVLQEEFDGMTAAVDGFSGCIYIDPDEETLDMIERKKAEREARKADLMLVLGTSLTVYPAAAVPEITLQSGGKVAIINRDRTHLDRYACWVARDLKKEFEELTI